MFKLYQSIACCLLFVCGLGLAGPVAAANEDELQLLSRYTRMHNAALVDFIGQPQNQRTAWSMFTTHSFSAEKYIANISSAGQGKDEVNSVSWISRKVISNLKNIKF